MAIHTTSKWFDIKSDYTDENAVTHIDAFVTPDDNEEGKIIALIVNGEVYYKDYDAMTDEYAQGIISAACKESKATAQTATDAVNNTAGNGIDPNAVPGLLEALKDLVYSQNAGMGKKAIQLRIELAKDAIKAAEIK